MACAKCAVDGVIAESESQAAALWALREHVTEAELKTGRSVKHDVSVPVNRIPDFIRDADAALRKQFQGLTILAFGHVGDGNVHFNVLGASNEADAVNKIVHDVVAEYEGSISAEHGVGCYRVAELAHYKGPAEIALMRKMKDAMDPQGILNPSKVLDRNVHSNRG